MPAKTAFLAPGGGPPWRGSQWWTTPQNSGSRIVAPDSAAPTRKRSASRRGGAHYHVVSVHWYAFLSNNELIIEPRMITRISVPRVLVIYINLYFLYIYI